MDELVDWHFSTWTTPDHPNRQSIHDALAALERRPAVILETGSSAWGTKSSQLFDAYVASFGGEFATVDLRLGPLLHLRPILSEHATIACMDSIRFLSRWVERCPGRRVDLVYLDSWDLDANEPLPSAIHGLRELMAIRPALREGSLVLVDDSPSNVTFYAEQQQASAARYADRNGLLPGKGMLIDTVLGMQPAVEKVHHDYQALYRFN